MVAPPMDENNVWTWKGAQVDFAYPMSLDGHIFRTKEILPLLIKLKYNNPNTLEGELVNHPINATQMVCYDKPKIINNPLNKVQDVNNNKHGNVTALWLNKEFMSGKIIDLKTFHEYENHACHEEIPITLINERNSN